ncbi:histidine kinase [Ottowia sp.]|uniref:histidine kinase n=1 Tax=Ottowia sp. TaxID=1898956 RepID=UPI003A89B64A
MRDSRILSTLKERRLPPVAAKSTPQLVFDACQTGVMLRAVLYVETVIGAALLYVTSDAVDWLLGVALITAAALPATLMWLVLGCSLKHLLGRLPLGWQVAAGVVLGALAGLFACGLMAWLDLVGMFRPGAQAPWLASAVTGMLLAAGLVAGMAWRVRGRTPAATAARLVELQSRIRPHFLFNTLNSAIALVRDEPAKAERVLEDLSDLFRHALSERQDATTLGAELELARRYLDIEQVRFGRRLRVEWSLDERVSGARVPPMILQPLVENAVKHGVEPSPSGAQIRVSTQLRNQSALIKVTNTVPAGQGKSGHGIALGNVRDRLRLLYDLEGGFRTALVKDVYQARIQVPMPKK